jgi:hypothetical protein
MDFIIKSIKESEEGQEVEVNLKNSDAKQNIFFPYEYEME